YLLLSAFLLARSFHLFLMLPPPPRSTLFPYTTLFRSLRPLDAIEVARDRLQRIVDGDVAPRRDLQLLQHGIGPPGSEHVPGEEQHRESVHGGEGRAGDEVRRPRPDRGRAGQRREPVLRAGKAA